MQAHARITDLLHDTEFYEYSEVGFKASRPTRHGRTLSL